MKETINDEKKRVEKKHVDRFLVEFPEEFNLPSWTIIKLNKPQLVNSEWLPIEITFVDPIEKSVSKSLYELIKIVKELKKGGSSTLFHFKIKILGLTGDIVEMWKIGVKDIFSIDFGKLDYFPSLTNQCIEPKLMLVPKFCKYVS